MTKKTPKPKFPPKARWEELKKSIQADVRDLEKEINLCIKNKEFSEAYKHSISKESFEFMVICMEDLDGTEEHNIF